MDDFQKVLIGAMAILPRDQAHFTKAGKPDSNYLSEMLGVEISAVARDEAWGILPNLSSNEAAQAKQSFADFIDEQKAIGNIKTDGLLKKIKGWLTKSAADITTIGVDENTETKQTDSKLVKVSVKVKAPHKRRCRAGLCFDGVVKTTAVNKVQLKVLQADPLLIIKRI